jgi:hypothetical protein
MLNLPLSTEVNRTLPKDRLGINKKIALEIESVIMKNQITPDTVNLPLGDIDKGFCVMEVKLRTTAHEKEILTTLAKIPQSIIFAVTFEDKTEYAVFYKGKLYKTDTAAANLSVYIANVFEELQAQIIGVTVETTLEQAVFEKEERNKLILRLETLERKAWTEKQPRKKLAYAEEIMRIKELLNAEDKTKWNG